MKKLFSLLVVALATVVAFAAEPIILDPSTQTEQIPGEEEKMTGIPVNVTIEGITLEWQGALYNSDFRVFANGSIKISAEQKISKVVIAGKANKAGGTNAVDAGTITVGETYAEVTTKADLEDPLIVIEDVDANSVTLSNTKQLRLYKIAVYLGEDTALENVEGAVSTTRKIVENGQIYILKDGVKYNIFGAEVH